MPNNFSFDARYYVFHLSGYFLVPINIVEFCYGTHLSNSEMVEFFQVLTLNFINWDQNVISFRANFAPLLKQYFSEVFYLIFHDL